MKNKRIVVTGLGVVSPIGSQIKTFWESLVSGRSGIRKISTFDTADLPVKISGSIVDFDADSYIPRKNQKKMDSFIQYGIAAATQAINDSGLKITEENASRIGVALGSGIGGLPMIEANYDSYQTGGARKISPFFIPSTIINMISGNLSILYGIKGPNLAMVSACTTGTHNIGEAARIIDYGDADVMIAGSAEMATTPLCVGGFAAARALSPSHDDEPEKASRPWDADRNGFVLGDGAGVVILEDYVHAQARGADIYCELAGYGRSGDAYHMTQPAPGGEGAAQCMQNALNDAGESPGAVDYINAHATSTPLGDKLETDAIKKTFGDHAYRLPISSIKSMIGHLLGAAGSVEAVASVLSLSHCLIPPTINLETPDPDCDLDYVPGTAREKTMKLVLSNSFGFGGTNGTLLFRAI